MTEKARSASCRCGGLTAACRGDPVRTSACHCLACQKRTGTAFAAQVRFETDQVDMAGEAKEFVRVADSGRKVTYKFCPTCGSTIAYRTEAEPQLLAIPLGAFDDPFFATPQASFNERRRHGWVELASTAMEHHD